MTHTVADLEFVSLVCISGPDFNLSALVPGSGSDPSHGFSPLPMIQDKQLSVTGEGIALRTGKLPSDIVQKQCSSRLRTLLFKTNVSVFLL